jgi:hypothetical protein
MTDGANVVVLVPRRAGVPERDRVWDYLKLWWKRHTSWPVIEGHHYGGPFNRSRAINRAAQDAGSWDIAIIADADALVSEEQLAEGIRLARSADRYIVAFEIRNELAAESTERIISGSSGDWGGMQYEQVRGACSAMNVINRTLWERVGGFDERFVGWGWEDVAFAHAADTFAGQDYQRVPGVLWHFYHPPSPEQHAESETYKANTELHDRYANARMEVERMRRLLG